MEGSNNGVIYGLEFQCRALASLDCEDDSVRFAVGTQGLRVPCNQVSFCTGTFCFFEGLHFLLHQIHVVNVIEDETKTISKRVYNHPQGEIWQIASNKVQHDLVCVRFSNVETDGTLSQGANVYDLSKNNEDSVVSDYCIKEKDLNHVSWMPGEASKLMALAENRLVFYDVNSHEPSSTGRLEGKGFNELTYGAWNMHQNCQQYATVNDYHIRGWDVRSMKQAWTFESPGNQVVRCIDFNPNKQYYLISSGDDGAVRFWDIRNAKKALAVRNDHSHWVWSVRYNQYHDQLILSSSSDGHVVLSSMASLSSEPHGQLMEDEDEYHASNKALEDGKIRTFDDHEDSVYCAEWSATDPWIFASLSYDGRLVINNVPRNIKFRILNLV